MITPKEIEQILLKHSENTVDGVCIWRKEFKNVAQDIYNTIRTTPQGKIQYADYVSLTEKEYNSLVNKYGKEVADKCITYLDNYKGALPSKRKYESDYRAILSWVIDKVGYSANTFLSKTEVKEWEERAKSCWFEHGKNCETPSYTITGNMLMMCKYCRDNSSKWK